MSLELEKVAPDRLSREVWRFDLAIAYGVTHLKIVLDEWCPQTRATTRHKWVKACDGYQRRQHNSIVHYGGWMLPAADVPWTTETIAKIIMMVRDGIEMVGPFDPEDKRQ